MRSLLFIIFFAVNFGLSRELMASNSSQPETPDESALLITFPDPGANKKNTATIEDIEISIDSKQPATPEDKAGDTIEKLLKLSEVMSGPKFEEALKLSLYIPISTADTNLIHRLRDLSADDLQLFIQRKSKYLRGIRSFLKLFVRKKEELNGILLKMNDSFFANPNVIINLDTINIGSAGGFISLGPSLSDAVLRRLRKIPMFKNLPENAGFYFSTSIGINFSMTTLNDRRKFRVEPVVDHRVGDRFYTPFLIAGFGVPFTITFESRGDNTMSLLDAKFMKTSLLTVIGGEKVLGFSIPLGVGLTGGLGAGAGVSGHLYRLNLLDPANFGRIVSYLKGLVYSRPKTCKWVFR